MFEVVRVSSPTDFLRQCIVGPVVFVCVLCVLRACVRACVRAWVVFCLFALCVCGLCLCVCVVRHGHSCIPFYVIVVLLLVLCK